MLSSYCCYYGLLYIFRQQKRGLEEGVAVSILLPSGRPLVDTTVSLFDTVALLRQQANDALASETSRVPSIQGQVCKLVSANGQVLDDNTTLAVFKPHKYFFLTAVVIEDTLHDIERMFHDLIMEKSGWKGNPSKFTERYVVLPNLKTHVEEHGSEQVYYDVPGMYGGFNTSMVKDDSGWKLTCESWTRICEESGERHEITKNGMKLLEP